MSSIKDLIKIVDSLDVEKEWSEAEVYNEVNLRHDPNFEFPHRDLACMKYSEYMVTWKETFEMAERVPGQMGATPFKHNKIHGVYMWLYKGIPIYIGKSDQKPNSSIMKRQDCHVKAFKGLIESESSGRKFREFMRNSGLQSADFVIKYIDLTKAPKGLIPLIEDRSIEYFQPKLNSEISGYGVRY